VYYLVSLLRKIQKSGAIGMRIVKETDQKQTTIAVKYEDRWFWIDKGDFRSKQIFTFLMILFSLTETGGKEGLPLVTIPAG
jgi:hypothetical protein